MDHELDRPRGHGGGGFKMSEGDWTCEEEGYVISSFSFIVGWSAHFLLFFCCLEFPVKLLDFEQV